jgi:hypothetical protein
MDVFFKRPKTAVNQELRIIGFTFFAEQNELQIEWIHGTERPFDARGDRPAGHLILRGFLPALQSSEIPGGKPLPSETDVVYAIHCQKRLSTRINRWQAPILPILTSHVFFIEHSV